MPWQRTGKDERASDVQNTISRKSLTDQRAVPVGLLRTSTAETANETIVMTSVSIREIPLC